MHFKQYRHIPQKGHWLPAYMTLEASLCLPLVIAVLASCLILEMYLYGLFFYNQAAYRAAFRGSTLRGNTSEKQEACEKAMTSLTAEKIQFAGDASWKAEASLFSVKVTGTAEFPLPLPGFLPTAIRSFPLEISASVINRDPVSYIRNLRRFASD